MATVTVAAAPTRPPAAPDLLATPWREAGVPVPTPRPVDGPPPLARVVVGAAPVR